MGRIMLVAAAALAAACVQKKDETSAQPGAPETGLPMAAAEPVAAAPPVADIASETAMTECPIIDSRNWKAWIDRMPMVDQPGPRLHVAGEIDLPTPGYAVTWSEGPMDRAMPPGFRLLLTATPPDGMTTQVVTPTAVKYMRPAAHDRYRVIYVVCAGKAVAEITQIDIVE